MTQTLLKANLDLLRASQPLLASRLERLSEQPTVIEIAKSPRGEAVPYIDNSIFHDLKNPAEEGLRMASAVLGNSAQQRLLVFGFGFGYHVRACCTLGYSPLVYEPDILMLRAAFQHCDLSDVIPHTTFYVGNGAIPNLAPGTRLLVHPVSAHHYPLEADRVTKRLREECTSDDAIVDGIKKETYRNVLCLKDPAFLVCYQMIISLVRPTVIIEIGTCRGGAALYYADFLSLLGGERHVYTIDVWNEVAPELFEHPRITFHPYGHRTFDLSFIKPTDRVLVIEDSSHTYENTLEVLNRFGDVVTANSYLIVEDTDSDGEPFNGGPMRAVKEYLPKHPEFERDKSWETFFGPEHENHCVFLRKLPK